MALLTGEPRSATVYAIRDTELVKLSKAAFERMVERQPQMMLEVARLIIARYQRVINAPDKTQPVALAVVPADASVPVTDFVTSLARALSPARKVLALDPQRLQRERGTSGDPLLQDWESAELAGWLQEQELQHDYLVYAADPLPSAWTRLCVRQADLVLLVGAAGAAAMPQPGLLEIVATGNGTTAARRELVLLYDSTRQSPYGTAEWLARIPVTAHHHLDPRRSDDYERLARMLTGEAIGLVLGGGGARGLAHIGVIRALEEARIPIDLVGGTSIGAMMGGQFASGWDSARMLAESRRALVEGGSLHDYTLPILALMHGKRFTRMLSRLFADRLIEDLPLPYFCVSTNLTRSTCMVHRAGPMSKWVSASMAVPGLAPPIFDGRDILVDGGVVNNLPVDIMRSFGRGPVFASSVSAPIEMRLDQEYADIPSPWRVLLSWISPFGKPMLVPTITSTLMRTVSLQQITSGAQGHGGADLIFEPPPQGHKLLEWRSLDKIVETGYRSAVPAIERWLQRGTSPSH
jgi:predicted acylesterase/phospholipase RssA